MKNKSMDYEPLKELNNMVRYSCKIIAHLFMSELIAKNGAMVFIYAGVKMAVNGDIVANALQENLLSNIKHHADQENKLLIAIDYLDSMYESDKNRPTGLTEIGRKALTVLCEDGVDNYLKNSSVTLH